MKASSVADALGKSKTREVKKPVHLRHLAELARELSHGSQKERIALTVAWVALWGMARLGETKIALYHTKTAKPGEIQWLHLDRIPFLLCPWSAMQPSMNESTSPSIHLPLFPYYKKGRLVTLSDLVLWAYTEKPALLTKVYPRQYWWCEVNMGSDEGNIRGGNRVVWSNEAGMTAKAIEVETRTIVWDRCWFLWSS